MFGLERPMATRDRSLPFLLLVVPMPVLLFCFVAVRLRESLAGSLADAGGFKLEAFGGRSGPLEDRPEWEKKQAAVDCGAQTIIAWTHLLGVARLYLDLQTAWRPQEEDAAMARVSNMCQTREPPKWCFGLWLPFKPG